MSRKGLCGTFLLSCVVATWPGCGGTGWEPVAGKDAKAFSLIVPTLHRDETHTVTLRVFSNGTETIPAGFQAKLEVFEDDSYSVAYCAPITTTQPSDLASRQLVDMDFSLPVDIATSVGTTLYLVATVASLDEVDEAIETNNSLETSRVVALERRADLVVEDIDLPDYMLQGSSYTVTVTVRNIDDKTATAPFSVEIAEPSVPWSNTWPVASDLAPGESIDLTTTYTVGGAAALGDRTFTATADTTAAVDERDEGNNSLSEVSPVATMDLVLEMDYALSDPEYVVGYPFTAVFRVTNNGSVASPPTSVSIYMLDFFGDPLRTWSPSAVPSLAPGGHIDITRAVTITTSDTLDRYLLYHVDYDDLIEENDELNNVDGFTLLPL